MCIILFAINQHPQYKFIVAANRDEFYERPTAPADFWTENPNVLAGKDLVYGGTWLGVSRTGRFAAVTNFRNPNQPKGELSRGNLCKDFLFSTESPQTYLQQIKSDKEKYTGFNLIVGEFSNEMNLSYYSNVSDEIITLNSGIYGLSNHLLDTNWHKVANGKSAFAAALEDVSSDRLFEILANKTLANDDVLPNTGVGVERERVLSPIFIETPIYGTRCSTLILVDHTDNITFIERNYDGNPVRFSENTFNL
jgi:uncharacterized protein with NRDE domain